MEQPTFAGSRSLLAPDRTRGWVPVPSSYQLRVMGAFSRHIVKGMQRIGVESGDPDLLATAFADGQNETLVVVNRSSTARKLAVQGATHPWAEMERTGLEEENAVSAVPPKSSFSPEKSSSSPRSRRNEAQAARVRLDLEMRNSAITNRDVVIPSKYAQRLRRTCIFEPVTQHEFRAVLLCHSCRPQHFCCSCAC